MTAVTLKGSYLLNSLVFAAGLAAFAAVGCGDDSSDTVPQGMAGTGTAGAAGMTAGTGAAGTTAGTGAAGTTAGTGAAGTTGAAATLTDIYQMIYVLKCAVCHAMPPSDSANGKLGGIRDKNAFHAAVVGKPTQGVMCAGKGIYVVAGQPAQSVLLQKVSASPPCGVQMPVGNPLEESEIKMLTDWVAAGAPNN